MIEDFIQEENLLKSLIKLTKDGTISWAVGKGTLVTKYKGSTAILMVAGVTKAIQIYDDETDYCIGTEGYQELLIELHNTIIKL